MLDRYILCSDVVVPTGFNLDLARAVYQADLGNFDSEKDSVDGQMKTVARIPFIAEEESVSRIFAILDMVMTNIMGKLTINLKPLPLYITLPDCITDAVLADWKEKSEFSKYISHVSLRQEKGNQFLEYALNEITDHDAILCVAIDDPIRRFDEYAQERLLFSSQTPWGIIPSEGGVGLVFTKRAVVDTLKLQPESKVDSFFIDRRADDGRACSRLARVNGKTSTNFGYIYSDMTNQRHHVEDYGFAIGARSELFPNPEAVNLINEMWGNLGDASSLTTLTLASNEVSSEMCSTLFLFGDRGTRAIMTISKYGV
ncbi:hypothetical protein MHO82_13600 [Vibrio sp. Of7-15]|uniref:hypothetical protein n=1 Tax=Vibrio sp. Of7-15 TaxID=2724879 RepID=UPI001EF207DF|nr:hypothetical protein [Vibrio sp. Of7-15]MCG7497900.1 hypothetical protein [Vibrio sp. Of7-15]